MGWTTREDCAELSLQKTDTSLFSGSCGLPHEGVAETSDVRDRNDFARFWRLNFPAVWRVHLQALVDAIPIVVMEIVSKDSTEVRLAEDDHVVKAFSANAPVLPF